MRKKLNKALKRKYYYANREYPYKNVKPRIIIEKMMHNHKENGLIDYKIHCFNGRVRLILACADREAMDGIKKVFYDESWNKLDLKRPNTSNDCQLERPRNLNKMIELAELLSHDLPFVRVDFYEINKKLYFGELSFFPEVEWNVLNLTNMMSFWVRILIWENDNYHILYRRIFHDRQMENEAKR